MIEKTTTTTYVEVMNRNNGTTGYTLNDGRHESFQAGETRKISLNDLEELSYIPGGQYMLENYLIIKDQSALDFLQINTEPEYFYTEAEISKILLSSDPESLDQLEDCLNFAPAGVIEIVKDIAVKKQIPDVRKRKLITKMTGFSIDNAIMVNEILNDETPEEETAPKRKATPVVVETSTSTRKSKPVNTVE